MEGITRAIRTFSAPDKKISIYVFGDEFTGKSIDDVVNTVDRLNRRDAPGRGSLRDLSSTAPQECRIPGVQRRNPLRLPRQGARIRLNPADYST